MSTESEQSNPKADRLEQVFNKAVGTAVRDANEIDLSASFGPIKQQLGGSLQRIYLNSIHNTELEIQKSFKKLSNLYNIHEALQQSSQSKDSDGMPQEVTNNSVDSSERIIDGIVHDVRKKEKEELKNAIQNLNNNIKQTKEHLHRLREQIYNEVATAKEEAQKLSIAASHAINSRTKAN